jgi:hypothetical protein
MDSSNEPQSSPVPPVGTPEHEPFDKVELAGAAPVPLQVEELLAELGDADPADAVGPAGRIADLLGNALEREDR